MAPQRSWIRLEATFPARPRDWKRLEKSSTGPEGRRAAALPESGAVMRDNCSSKRVPFDQHHILQPRPARKSSSARICSCATPAMSTPAQCGWQIRTALCSRRESASYPPVSTAFGADCELRTGVHACDKTTTRAVPCNTSRNAGKRPAGLRSVCEHRGGSSLAVLGNVATMEAMSASPWEFVGLKALRRTRSMKTLI